jgi:hypothetical protein
MDALNSLLETVDQVSWSSYGGYEYSVPYDPSAPPRAFRRLVAAQNESDAATAYNAMLNAIGNNHRGSYYAAARPAVPLLVQAAVTLSGWQRWAAVEILTDLTVSFGSEDRETEILDVFVEAVERQTGRFPPDSDEALELLRIP